jgi:hypothetical protein
VPDRHAVRHLRPSRLRTEERIVAVGGVAVSILTGWLLVYVSDPHLPATAAAAPRAIQAMSTTAARLAVSMPPLAQTTTATATTATTAPTTTHHRATATATTAPTTTHHRAATTTASRRTVRVRVQAGTPPTYLCVDDGRGHQLYHGTLEHAIVFLGRHLRLNVGLSSARITVDGKLLTVPASPAGLDIASGRAPRTLAAGDRPCA